MPKPPFRKGLNPLFRVGLIDDVSGPFARFLWFCEGLYLDNLLLRNALLRADVDAEAVLEKRRPFGTTPGSRGPHRKVFDPWYEQIATNWQVRRASQAQKGHVIKRNLN